MDSPEIVGGRLWAKMGYTDSKYLKGLMLLTAAIDEDFQTKVRAIAEATKGRCRSAPPKGFARMVNKLATDHLWEWDPRGACNIDMSRNGIAYDSAKDLRIGFEALTRRFPALRIKNNMRKVICDPDLLVIVYSCYCCSSKNNTCAWVRVNYLGQKTKY